MSELRTCRRTLTLWDQSDRGMFTLHTLLLIHAGRRVKLESSSAVAQTWRTAAQHSSLYVWYSSGGAVPLMSPSLRSSLSSAVAASWSIEERRELREGDVI